jgi:hypothetical protein
MRVIYIFLLTILNGSCYYVKKPKSTISGLKNGVKWEISKNPYLEIIHQSFSLSNCSFSPKVLIINAINDVLNLNDNLGFSFLNLKIKKQNLIDKNEICQPNLAGVYYNISNDDTSYGQYILDGSQSNFIEFTKINEKNKCIEGNFEAHFVRTGGDRPTDPKVDFTNVKFEIYY